MILPPLFAAFATVAGIDSSLPPLARLPAAGPFVAYRNSLMDFGRLVGHWRMAIVTYRPGGAVRQKIRGT